MREALQAYQEHPRDVQELLEVHPSSTSALKEVADYLFSEHSPMVRILGRGAFLNALRTERIAVKGYMPYNNGGIVLGLDQEWSMQNVAAVNLEIIKPGHRLKEQTGLTDIEYVIDLKIADGSAIDFRPVKRWHEIGDEGDPKVELASPKPVSDRLGDPNELAIFVDDTIRVLGLRGDVPMHPAIPEGYQAAFVGEIHRTIGNALAEASAR